ncbi:hypothetical protein BO78DRAFT_159235 [Aspergillus sclerotiicarbonarius CBS 121057]|uniref:Uncharacterized protein n=1 Tax=Aspergillus sclerotiicarbonarius (strain CBS 121057 / IBT 28362) TaxID=1448318 RepID=A0A319E4C8_ASPSB|nr:hypothetical protein BO78DRAFT_159235 [Aspergillus sclerotiicarbonarius CBS 121057]
MGPKPQLKGDQRREGGGPWKMEWIAVDCGGLLAHRHNRRPKIYSHAPTTPAEPVQSASTLAGSGCDGWPKESTQGSVACPPRITADETSRSIVPSKSRGLSGLPRRGPRSHSEAVVDKTTPNQKEKKKRKLSLEEGRSFVCSFPFLLFPFPFPFRFPFPFLSFLLDRKKKIEKRKKKKRGRARMRRKKIPLIKNGPRQSF